MTKKGKGVLRIGTSNIVLPGTRQSFPAEFQQKTRLNYYSSLFNTLEINSSFYKVPMPATFEKWSLDVPDDFKFTVKLWKEITHVKNLIVDLGKIDSFLTAADRLGEKKGSLLIQFPGKITLEYYSQVAQVLERINEQDPANKWAKAVEFRSSTWYVSETYELLNEYRASLVLHDIPASKNDQLNSSAGFIYLRFHGPAGDYRGGYSNEFLKEKSARIASWLKSGKDVYVYFNNTIGSAFDNAMALKDLTSRFE